MDEAGEGAVALLESPSIVYDGDHQSHDQKDEGGSKGHGEDVCDACHKQLNSDAKVMGNTQICFPLLQFFVSFFQYILFQVL